MSAPAKRQRLLLERLEERILLNAAVPTAALDVPSEEFINEDFNFGVNFDNTGAGANSTGFAPYVDVVIPAEIDASGAAVSFLGSSVTPIATATFDGAQWQAGGQPLTEHPLTGQLLDGTDALTAAASAGDQLLIVQLPFGSFTADQPVAQLDFSGVNLGGAVGTANNISARGGFAFGCDEFDNPGIDAPVVQAPTMAPITPSVIELTKSQGGDEEESASGPNYPLTYRLEVDIATGEDVTALTLADVLPTNSAYIGNLAFVNGPAPIIVSQPVVDTDGPGLQLDYGNLTGVAGVDLVVTYQLYLPDVIADNDGDNNDNTGFINNASVNANYLGNPVSDSDTAPLSGKLLAVQKGVSLQNDVEGNGITPGDTLSYTLSFQISDFTDFSAITLTDVLGNGLEVDTSFGPTFSFNENGVNTAGSFGLTSAANNPFTGNVTQTDLGGGVTQLVFDVSQELIDRGQDGVLAGDVATPATGGTITFRARILESFTAPAPGADLSVDIEDVLNNDVTISATTAGGDIESDTSSAAVTISGVDLEKTIFAVDGNQGFNANDGLSPGQEVTYRIRVEFPTADLENLVLTDFLPLPVFDATSIGAASFDNTFPPGGGTPLAGTAAYGPDHNLNAQAFLTGAPNDPPTIVTDATANTIAFQFGTFDASPPTSTVVIDVLFTVALLDKPFGDGLFLTNQSVSSFGNTGGTTVSNTEIVQIVLNQPELNLSKGVVASDSGSASFDVATGPVTFNGPGAANPFAGTVDSSGLAATPVDANIVDGIDAGDIVTFALVVENTGGSEAFDILLRDSLPTGFVIPGSGLNLQVRTGDDPTSAISFSDVGGGLFSAVAGEGIRINDPAGGVLDDRNGAAGSNVLVVTYDLEAAANVGPTTLHENTAILEAFSAREGGTDFTDGFDDPAYENVASVITAAPTVSKALSATDQSFTDGNEVTIGEVSTYEILVTLPEGEITDLVVRDLVPAGLIFVGASAQLITAAAGSTQLTADFAGTVNLVSAVSGGGSGDDIVFTLDNGGGGNVVVNNDNNTTNNSFVLSFDATVADVPGNDGLPPGQTTLNNRARIEYTDNDGAANNGVPGAATPITSAPVTTIVVEPDVQIDKDIDLDTLDAGDIITVTLTLSNSGTSDAFDLEIVDVVDAVVFTNITAGAAPAGFINNSVGNTIRYNAAPGFGLAEGSAPVVFTFTAEVTNAITPGQIVTNTATVTSANSIPGGGRDGSGDTGVDSAQVELGLSKAIVTTSESHTGAAGGTDALAVGEIVRYRVEIEVPESSALDLTVQDLLPDGLQFINPHTALDNSARIAFVSDGGLSSAGAIGIVDASAFVLGDETTLAGITPTFALADVNISSTVDANNDVYTSGSDIFFRLGDVTNADSDANAEFIIIEFNALATNIASNNAGVDLDNSVRALSDNGGANTQIGSDSAAVTVTINEPAISATKAITTLPVDAGDTVVYDITVTNSAAVDTSSGFDIRVVDDLDALDPGTLNLVSAVLNAGATGAVLSNNATAGNLVDMTIDQLDAGESVTITVTATLSNNLTAGQQINNNAALSYSSLPGASGTTSNPTGSQTPGAGGGADGERDGSGGLNDHIDSDGSFFTAATPSVDKRLTDESITTAGIGATISYDIVITVPEGHTENLRVNDNIPTGLAVVDAQLITTAAGSPYLSSDFLGTIENAANVAAVVPQDNGVDLLIDLGDVDATATAATSNNQFVIRVTTLVLNDPATSGLNGAQTSFTNDAEITYNDPDDGPGNTPLDVVVNDPSDPTVTAVEPELNMSKSVSVGAGGTSGDAGDSVSWTIVVSHTANSTAGAFDLDLSDTLPAGFSATGFTASINAANDTAAALNLAGNVLSTIGDIDLALGEELTVVISGSLLNNTQAGSNLTNNAALTYTTGNSPLDDLLGGAGGPNDAQDDERSAMTGDSATISVPRPTFEKTIVRSDEAATLDALGELTIGETVTYGLVFTLPEGSYSEIIVSDDIPIGLNFVGGSATIVPPAGYNGTLPTIMTAGGGGSGNDVTFTLSAPFVVNGDNNTANNTFTLEYQAIVVNAGTSGLAGGQTPLNNQASVTQDDPDNPGTPYDLEVTGMPGTTTDSEMLEVVEPDLVIEKTSAVTRADPGDIVTYTLTISHSALSTGSAFDVVITDQLLGTIIPAVPPDKLDLVGAPAVATSAGTITIGSAAPGDQEIRIDVAEFARGDAPIVVTYSALLNGNTLAVGDNVTNTASVVWDSHSATPAEQRTAAPVMDSHTISTPLTTAEFDKTIIATSLAATDSDRLDPSLVDLVVGETVTYRLVTTFAEGSYAPQALDATVSDQLPDFLALVGGPRVITGGSSGVGMNVDLATATTTFADNNGDTQNDFFSIDFDLNSVAVDLVNTELLHDQIWIEYDAIVLDSDNGTNNLNGNTLSNNATLAFDPSGANIISNASAAVEIVDPNLVVNKSASDTTPNLGDTVTYTIVVEHAANPTLTTGSGNTAYDLVISDALAPQLSLVAGSVSIVEQPAGLATSGLTIVSGNNSGDTSVVVTADSLELFNAPEGRIEISFEVITTTQVNALTNVITNTATVDYDNIAGDDPNQRSKTADDDATVRIVGPDLIVTKTDSAVTTTPGSALTYTIQVTNNAAPFGNPANADNATNVTVVDSVPEGVSFVSSPDAEFVGFNATTREASWIIPLLAPGAVANLTLNTSVDNPAPAGVERLNNQVVVSSDEPDLVPEDNAATDETALDAAPDLGIVKSDFVDDVAPGDRLSYRIEVSNSGNQGSSGIVVVDEFNAELLNIISASQPSGVNSVTINNNAGTITWLFDELAGGDNITLTVNATVANPLPAATEQLTNNVGVSDDGSSGPDANPGNEQSSDTNLLTAARPDYAITKSNQTDAVRPGETTTYTITVSNVGNQAGTNITVVDEFDSAALVNVEASDGGVVDLNNGTITWMIPSLAGGGSELILSVTAVVKQPPPAGQQTLVNNVSVSDDGSNGDDPTPQNNRASDSDDIEVFVFDSLQDESLFGGSPLDEFFADDAEQSRFAEPLPVDALFSGHAEPHTVLVITLYDANGASIGQQITVTDSGGNWVANFGGTVISGQPHAISIEQQSSALNGSTTGGFNLRTYFSPALHSQLFFSYRADGESIESQTPATVLESMSQANRNPLALGWNDTNSYEFLASSSTTTQYIN